MSTGIPLVATTGGAIPEVVGPDGVTAFSVPPGDSEALAAALRALLADPARLQAMSAAARQRAAAEFSLPLMVTRIETLYRELLAT